MDTKSASANSAEPGALRTTKSGIRYKHVMDLRSFGSEVDGASVVAIKVYCEDGTSHLLLRQDAELREPSAIRKPAANPCPKRFVAMARRAMCPGAFIRTPTGIICL